jgi:hypothetical protein
MRKELLIFAVFAVFLLNFVSAACVLTPTLINQDPYPAVPGDYVKLVFQVSGVENPECRSITFRLVPQYPISFDPGVSPDVTIKGGTYTTDYLSLLIIPYKVRLDDNALDGNTTLELIHTTSNFSDVSISNEFNITVRDVRTNFNVFVKDYNFATNTLTFVILNIGKSDVDSLALEIPEQNNVSVKGPNINVVGSLSSNDYTTADFEVAPVKANLNVIVHYNDATGTRRSVNETVLFNPDSFSGRKTSQSSSPWGIIITVLIIAGIVAYIFYRRHKKNRKKRLLRE